MTGPVSAPGVPDPAVVTAGDMVAGQVRPGISCLDRMYFNLILSFRVSRGCDLRRLAEDGVFDETGAAWSCLFQPQQRYLPRTGEHPETPEPA